MLFNLCVQSFINVLSLADYLKSNTHLCIYEYFECLQFMTSALIRLQLGAVNLLILTLAKLQNIYFFFMELKEMCNGLTKNI